jgi:sulfate transport system substrate-binding protein
MDARGAVTLDKQIEMLTIDDPVFGGWDQAQPKHFDAGGLFDQIYQPAR